MLLTIKCKTALKPTTAQSATLPRDRVATVEPGQQFDAAYVYEIDSHLLLTLKEPYHGHTRWVVFGNHVDGFVREKKVPVRRADSVVLEVPYLSQLDNKFRPHGTCNVTAIAMCLSYLAIEPREKGTQLEDELYLYMHDHGLNRHSPRHLEKVVHAYGRQDQFREDATFSEIIAWINQGNPVVVHGYFTRSGHIVTVVGHKPDGLIIHDPYGLWLGGDRYDTSKSGEFVKYTFADLARVLSPESPKNPRHIWAHFIGD
jgi:uncharacterized protein YvpB